MKLVKIVVSLIGAIFLLLVSVIVYAQLSADPRGVIDIQPSPNKQLVAYSYYDSGGGGAGYCSYGINIIKLGGDIKIFSFHAGQDTVFEAVGCDEGYSFEWNGDKRNQELRITCPNNKNQIAKKSSFEGINLSYSGC